MVATRDLKSLVFTDVRVRVPSLVQKRPSHRCEKAFFIGMGKETPAAEWAAELLVKIGEAGSGRPVGSTPTARRAWLSAG
jgi:hypothetical protein